ncbi:PREDICTED: protein ELC-like [Tarenaya hassleriana]|uniref:protein ELC-like n=1 Tax=Tarenaya hassleriana TaxID=28532 RepID=UPI00053C4AB1|nr:PREDICTED: protein ELC-like [Tarenaya hassleriana]
MVPPPSNPPNPQQIQQFLSSVLSQRGPSALPYAESTKWLIRQHLLNLVSSYPSLEPKTATFTHNDGRSVNLLQADGTVPMPFQGVTYNIPVVIWLLESYPRHPPCVYVNPTRDMIIKRPHSHVTPSGLASVPYLQNWVYPSSNLVDLVSELSAVFARDPPLYSQRRPQPPSSPSPAYSSSSIGSGYGSSSATPHTRPPVDQPPLRPFPPSPYGGGGRVQHLHHQHHPPSQQQTDDAAEVYKKNAINKIVEMVHGDLAAMRRAKEGEAEGLLSLQASLKRREEEINKGFKEMIDEKEGLEQQLQVISMNTDILDSWVRENEGKTKNLGDLDVDNAFECVDTLSKQMLECTALDLAIEDTVYSLDKALQDGAVPFDQYLRNVRLLSREQFFHRATAAKVRAAQMEVQVASIAARLHS